MMEGGPNRRGIGCLPFRKVAIVRSASLKHWIEALLVAGVAPLVVGCDLTGQYERRFQETLVSSGARAVFDQQLYPTDTEILAADGQPSGIKLRIPRVFDDKSVSLAAEPRSQPPFLKIPGFKYALERALDDPSGQFAPAYIYFGAVPKGDQKPDQVLGPVATTVAAAFPGTNWADATATTPDGSTVTHKVLRAIGQQDFDLAGTGGAIQKLDGKFELYFVESPSHYAFVGFRAPTAQTQKYQLDTAIQAALGTVNAASGAAAAPAATEPAATPPAGATPAAATPAAAGM